MTVPAGVPLHVRDHGGAGPAVLLLHGGGRDADDWRLVVPHLRAGGRRVVAMDLRGHGLSGPGPWSWPAALGDVAEVVAHLRLDRPAVVGHSLGGMVAALWAVEHPECPYASNVDGHGSPRSPDDYAGYDAETAQAAHRRVRAFYADLEAESTDPLLPEIVEAVAELDLFDVYRRTSCPLLIVSGRRLGFEHLLPAPVQEAFRAYRTRLVENLAAVAADVPLVSLARLPTDHEVHLQEPARLAELLLAHDPR